MPLEYFGAFLNLLITNGWPILHAEYTTFGNGVGTRQSEQSEKLHLKQDHLPRSADKVSPHKLQVRA